MWPALLLLLAGLPVHAGAQSGEPLVPRGDKGGYLTLEQVDAALTAIAAAAAPHSALTDIGTSVEGHPIRALCLGVSCAPANGAAAAPPPPPPAALFTGLMHAREPLGMMACVHYAAAVAAAWRAGEPDAVALLSHRALHFVPVVNPDGYAANLAVWGHPLRDLMRRKNRRHACNSGDVDTGIDLNRNFDFYFDVDNVGSSPSPCADDFRGPAPFSEPESVALRDLALANNFSLALNWHSYGRFVNLPWAVQRAGSPPPPVYDTFLNVAGAFAALTGFRYGHPYDGGLYSCNGEASDWMLDSRGTFAMSPELGPHMDAPFEASMWPNERAQPALLAEALAISARAAWAAGPLLEASVAPAASGGAALVACGPDCARLELVVRVRNNGVRRSDGVLAVALVDGGAAPASAAFCDAAIGGDACAATWSRAGLPLCRGTAPPTAQPPAALSCAAPTARVTDAILGDSADGRRGLGGAAAGDDGQPRQHRPSLARSAALLSLTREMIAVEAARVAALNGTARGAAAAYRGGSRDSDHSVTRLDAADVAAELDRREALAAAGGAGGGTLLLRPRTLQLSSVEAIPVTVAGTAGVAAAVRIAGGSGGGAAGLGLDAQHEAAPVVLRLQLPVSDAAACTLRAAEALQRNGVCSGAAVPSPPPPPAALLAISDELSCVVYAVACDGSATLLLRGAAGCAPCALLRTEKWEQVVLGPPTSTPTPTAAPPSPTETPSASGTAPSGTPTATGAAESPSPAAPLGTPPPTQPPSAAGSGTAAATTAPAYTPAAATAAPTAAAAGNATDVNASAAMGGQGEPVAVVPLDAENLAVFFATMIGVAAVVLVAFRRSVFLRGEPAGGDNAGLPEGAPTRMAVVTSV